MDLTKFKIVSYDLHDGRWGAAFAFPIQESGVEIMNVSERTELGKYFPTKQEADSFTIQYLKEKGIAPEFIQIS